MKKQIVHVSFADDWEGYYIDGILRYEDHSINLNDFLGILVDDGINLKEYEFKVFNIFKDGEYEDFITDDEMSEICWKLPDSLNDYINFCESKGYEIKIT